MIAPPHSDDMKTVGPLTHPEVDAPSWLFVEVNEGGVCVCGVMMSWWCHRCVPPINPRPPSGLWVSQGYESGWCHRCVLDDVIDVSYLLTPDPLRGYESGRVHVCVPPINPDPFRVMSRVVVYSAINPDPLHGYESDVCVLMFTAYFSTSL